MIELLVVQDEFDVFDIDYKAFEELHKLIVDEIFPRHSCKYKMESRIKIKSKEF